MEGDARQRLLGYAAGGLIAVLAIVIAVAVLSSDGSGGGGKKGEEVFPAGGEAPTAEVQKLRAAADAAGCELRSFKSDSREHVTTPVDYPSSPPAAGEHYPPPAPSDGIYEVAPKPEQLVHAGEHGRVVVWARKTLARAARADLRAVIEDDDYHMLLVPDETGMSYAVAATAWNAEPGEFGTGRLLGCAKHGPRVFDALAAFREEHRDRGPEDIP